MKSKNNICIISLTYLLMLFPVNLMSKELFTAKEVLTVFKKASVSSDSIYTIYSDDEVEVIEIKNVWLKKWAKIQKPTGEQGYVLFHDLKPINTNQEIKENNTNNEDASTQNTAVKDEYLEPQKENTQDFEKEAVNTSNEYTGRKSTSNNEQDNKVYQTNENSNKSFPTWGWFAIIGTIALGYSTYQYKKYLYKKFTYNIFSLSTIISLLLSFGPILFLNYLINHSVIGEMWGIPTNTFKLLLITASVITIGILYYYNFRKTNWYFAIFNIIIQSVAVGVFVIIAIGWIILKFLGSIFSSGSETSSQSNPSSSQTIPSSSQSNPSSSQSNPSSSQSIPSSSQSNSSSPSISTAVQKGSWVYVYDEKNRQLFSKTGRLNGYTSTTVSVKNDNWIYVYDQKGRQVSSHYLR